MSREKNYECPHCGAYDSTRCDMLAKAISASRNPTERELAKAREVGCRVAHYTDKREVSA